MTWERQGDAARRRRDRLDGAARKERSSCRLHLEARRRHTVRTVEGWREANGERSLYRIRTSGGMRCLISLDSGREIWWMERACH